MALEAANRVVKAMGSWVPARLGADETGMSAAFMTFGLPSGAGLALALARRSRDLMEVVIGFTWLVMRTRTGSWFSRPAGTRNNPLIPVRCLMNAAQ
jgi:hypothetical protein